MQLYVQGSKKQANEFLQRGLRVLATRYTVQGTEFVYINRLNIPNGASIKFWVKRDPAGTPIARAYGTWDQAKNRIL